MPLIIYNTLSRKKEIFKPIEDNKVNIFVCGQTPYDDAHLGHAKTYVNFDVIVRWIRGIGYNVKYIQNITDIEDKIIARAAELGIPVQELEMRYEQRFFEDMERIGVKKNIDQYPRSHEYINDIINQLQALIDKGYAYLVDGDLYYYVDKFANYTALSGMKLEELGEHRIEIKEGKKKHYDFALWKASKIGEPKWNIEVTINGKRVGLEGRPGWHIEDTAITQAIFGPQYDIHGGANELIFPHHTNEIAQAEASSGISPFVNYWMHSGVLNIKGKKMSKSEKNFITIREILSKYSSEALRLFICSTHYKKPIDYTGDQQIEEAEKRLSYMYSDLSSFYNIEESEISNQQVPEVEKRIDNYLSDFENAMNDDFNTPLAIMHLSGALNSMRSFAENNKEIGKEPKAKIIKRIVDAAGVLGILEMEDYKKKIPPEIKSLIKARSEMREKKDYAGADKIRMDIRQKYGIELDDTEHGTVWYLNIGKQKTPD